MKFGIRMGVFGVADSKKIARTEKRRDRSCEQKLAVIRLTWHEESGKIRTFVSFSIRGYRARLIDPSGNLKPIENFN